VTGKKRQRREVDYSDSLTEKEWLNAIGAMEDNNEAQDENEDDPMGGKRKRRRKNRRGREGDDENETEDITKKPKRQKDEGSSSGGQRLVGTTIGLKNQMKKILNIVVTYQDRYDIVNVKRHL